jgi:hypothetical protein
LDGGLADGLSQVTLARASWSEKQRIFALGDEASGGQAAEPRFLAGERTPCMRRMAGGPACPRCMA